MHTRLFRVPHFLVLLLALFTLSACSQAEDSKELLQAALQRVKEGKAVLVDVREPAEWAQTGVAEPAHLLAMSALRSGSGEWASFLAANKNREIMLMCRSGNRSGQVAQQLAAQGYRTTNLGGFARWKNAGLPVR